MGVDLRFELIKQHPRLKEVFKLWEDSLDNLGPLGPKELGESIYFGGNKLLGELFPACVKWHMAKNPNTDFPPLTDLGYKVFNMWVMEKKEKTNERINELR